MFQTVSQSIIRSFSLYIQQWYMSYGFADSLRAGSGRFVPIQLAGSRTLHVSDNSCLHHQEFFTVHTAMVYVIQVCRQPASWIGMFCPDPARRLSADLYDKYHCCMYSEKLLMMDRGTA